jgi:integration host factor subunit alpha
MTKADIAERIQAVTGFNRKESIDHLEEAFSIMKRMLVSGERLQISGFGSFEIKQKNDRKGRNPVTGEPITISARRVLSFKPSNRLRQSLNEAETN